jgi:hypothetical protein
MWYLAKERRKLGIAGMGMALNPLTRSATPLGRSMEGSGSDSDLVDGKEPASRAIRFHGRGLRKRCSI